MANIQIITVFYFVSDYMKQICEGVEDARQQADDLLNIVGASTSKTKTDQMPKNVASRF